MHMTAPAAVLNPIHSPTTPDLLPALPMPHDLKLYECVPETPQPGQRDSADQEEGRGGAALIEQPGRSISFLFNFLPPPPLPSPLRSPAPLRSPRRLRPARCPHLHAPAWGR